MKRVLAFSDYYPPGWRAGGSVRALINAVAFLRDHFDFRIVTRNHDESEPTPYPGITPNQWIATDGAEIRYVTSPSLAHTRRAVLEAKPDIVWLNSYFSPFTLGFLLLRRFARILRVSTVVLTPHGELSLPALRHKPTRKRILLRVSSILHLYRGVRFHATSSDEALEIRAIHPDADVREAENLLSPPQSAEATPAKAPGSLELLYLGRIAPIKNLQFLLETLAKLDHPDLHIRLQIVGPILDAEYWSRCQAQIAAFQHIHVDYVGVIPHAELAERFRAAHFLALPSLNENFGYAIVESWQHARPILISQSTPWRDLEKRSLGYDLPLESAAWADILRRCHSMDGADHKRLCQSSHDFYAQLYRDNLATEGERLLHLLSD